MRIAPLVLVAACGGGGSSSKVVVHADKTALAAVRTGDTWKPLALDANGDVTISLDDPTQIVTVCDTPGYFNYYTIYTGPGAEELQMYCAGVQTASIEVMAVAPSTTQVFIDLSSGPGGDVLVVRPGTYDIVAIDDSMNPPRFEIRRDVSITANMTVTFDLATTGTPMAKVPVTITGAGPGETPSRFLTYRAKQTFAYISYSSLEPDTFVFPSVGTGDRQHLRSSTFNEAMGSRSARKSITDASPITLALPPYLTSATATWSAAPSVTWQGDPRYDSQYFYVADESFTKLYDVLVMSEWGAAGGDRSKVEMPDPRAIPGWNASWNLPASPTGFDWYFDANDSSTEESFSASKSGVF